MSFETKLKHPEAVLDYGVDWTAWLALINDSIATSRWEVPAGLTVGSDSHGANQTSIWLSGGSIGQSYEITNVITTAGGRTNAWSILILIKAQ